MVASSATAFTPFSQNSAMWACPGSGHAHPGQSNPSGWFKPRSVDTVRRNPICPTPRRSDTATAVAPAAQRFGGSTVPENSSGGSATVIGTECTSGRVRRQDRS